MQRMCVIYESLTWHCHTSHLTLEFKLSLPHLKLMRTAGDLRCFRSQASQNMEFQVVLPVLKSASKGYSLQLHISSWSPATWTQENIPLFLHQLWH